MEDSGCSRQVAVPGVCRLSATAGRREEDVSSNFERLMKIDRYTAEYEGKLAKRLDKRFEGEGELNR